MSKSRPSRTIPTNDRSHTISNTAYIKILHAAEESALSGVLESRSRYAAAVEADALAGPAVDEADDRLSRVESAFYRGSSDYTAADHAEAFSAVTCANLRRKGATRRLNDTARAVRSSDTRVAGSIVPVLERALPGVKVLTSFILPETAPRVADRPTVLLVQSGPTNENAGGSLTGTVDVYYFRTDVQRQLDSAAVEAAAEALDMHVGAGFIKVIDGRDHLRLHVDKSFDSAPVIAEITPNAPHGLAATFAADLADLARYAGWSASHDLRTGLWESSHLTVLPLGSQVVAEHTDGVERTLTVSARLVVRRKVQAGRPLGDYIGEVVDALDAGAFLSGLGLIQSVNVSYDSTEAQISNAARDLARAEDRTVDASETGFEDLGHVLVTLTAVISSATEHVADAAA